MDRVLRFWWAFELFNPQSIPETTRGGVGGSYIVTDWRPGRRLPWTHLASPDRDWMWEYTVYVGVYQRSSIYGHLEKAFGTGTECFGERQPGDTAAAAFLVDQGGLLVADTAVLSSAAWSLGKLRTARAVEPARLPALLGAFPDTNIEFGRQINEQYWRPVAEDHEQDPLADPDLEAILREAHQACAVDGMDIASAGIRIRCQQVRVRRDGDEQPKTDFLNSQYLYELEEVRHALAAGECGPALTAYLTADDQIYAESRRDVLDTELREEIVARIGPGRIPAGRWPSNPAHSLASSQQFAVNEALDALGSSGGLMGVNGPPGTGKTTMLREIIAANVVTRAERLAQLAKPDDGFVTSSGADGSRVWRLRPELTGFEMVVASSNNAAVENISNELPVQEALHEQWHHLPGYFRATATDVLRAANPAARTHNTQAWGLIAARLGKKDHRRKFADAFWFGTANDPEGPPPTPIRDALRQYNPEQDGTWGEAVAAFRRAHTAVTDLLAPRQLAEQHRTELAAAHGDMAALEIELDELADQYKQPGAQLNKHIISRDRAAADTRAWDQHYLAHEAAKPSWWRIVVDGWQVKKDWQADAKRITDARAATYTSYLKHAREVERLAPKCQALQASIATAQSRRGTVQQRISNLQALTATEEATVPGYPSESWFRDESLREMQAPWLDETLNQARSELFLSALTLHRAFFSCSKSSVGRLGAAVDVVLGKPPFKLPPTAVIQAWQLLFLMVPVVSTTFASMRTMFNGLPPETLGWLFIDEAGQAKPQDAVGAIWRSRRVLAVGDPRQLQPIIVMPDDAENTLGHAFAVSDTWVPSRTSVQALADRIGVWGTTITTPQGDQSPADAPQRVWISAPLRVHRRCDEPMFSICNHIAYGGIMIQGNHCTCTDLPPTGWIDVPNPRCRHKVQPDEIDELNRLIDELTSTYHVREKDIFIIAPFRPIVDHIRRHILNRHPGIGGGTVHSVQGQEASIVILILGGDPDRRRSKTWAGDEPHLINVAVSRAKHRLYVIGDYKSWAPVGYFKHLAQRLPARPSTLGQRSTSEDIDD